MTIVSLPLKGNRNYVHGTSIFDYFSSHAETFLNEQGYISSINFRSSIRGLFEIKVIEPRNAGNYECDIELSGVSGRVCNLGLVDTGESCEDRISYDDEAIAANASIEDTNITLLGPCHSSFIECVVSITKKLHLDKFGANKGQWMFAKLSMRQTAPVHFDHLKIEIASAIASRYTRNDVYCDMEKIGEIQFVFDTNL